MKKIWKLIGLIAGVSSSIFVPIVLNITSCSKKNPSEKKEPTNYVGNDTGTNWKGYKAGAVSLNYDMTNNTCSIHSEDYYEAIDLAIPNQIEHENRIFNLEWINNGCFGFESNCLLSGSLYFPKNFHLYGFAFDRCERLNNILSFAGDVTIEQDNFDNANFVSVVLCGNCIFWFTYGSLFGQSRFNKINLGTRISSPTWSCGDIDKRNVFRNSCSPTGNIEVSGSWNNKQEVLEYMEQWGIPSTGWTVNGK